MSTKQFKRKLSRANKRTCVELHHISTQGGLLQCTFNISAMSLTCYIFNYSKNTAKS